MENLNYIDHPCYMNSILYNFRDIFGQFISLSAGHSLVWVVAMNNVTTDHLLDTLSKLHTLPS
jgi:hypothetical protein